MAFISVIGRRLVLPSCLLAVLALVVHRFDGFLGRFVPQVAAFERRVSARPEALRAGCQVPASRIRTKPSSDCRLGRWRPAVDGILLGDSYANHFSGTVDVMAQGDDLAIIDYTMDGCPPIAGYDASTLPVNVGKCSARNRFLFEEIGRQKYRYVILAAHWPAGGAIGHLVEQSIAEVIRAGAQVIVVLANPTIPNAARCPIRALMYGRPDDCRVRSSSQPDYWDSIRRRYPAVRFVDPAGGICGGGWCDPVRDCRLLYRGDCHLNDIGARLIGEHLRAAGVSLRGG